MKKITLRFVTILAILTLASSCDLTRKPKHEMEASESLGSVKDAQNWERSLMSKFRSYQGGINEMVQDIQGDQLNTTSVEGNNYAGSSSWERVTTGDYNRQDVYLGYYQSISNINKALEEMAKVQPAENEVKQLNVIKGRMYFLRAYYYANLALRYGTPYKASTASTDLCVPLHLSYNPTAKLPRATNAEVYAQILDKDLKMAEELLVSVKGKPMSDEITIDACRALESRVRLYMSDWSGALKVAKELIDFGTYPLITTKEQMKEMWLNDNSTEDILLLFVSRPDENTSINVYYGAKTDALRSDKKTSGANAPGFLPTKWMVDLYADNDFRKDAYFEKVECNFKDKWDNFYVVSKRKGNPMYAETVNKDLTFWGGYVPNSMHRPKVFRIAEQYLIASEAAYMLGNSAEALKYCTELSKSRGVAMDQSLKGDALYTAIKDERTRELAFEGFRLWDLRRWNMPCKRYDPQVNSKGDLNHLKPGLFDVTYPAGDYRFVWPIPANDINTNPSLNGQQNPGW